MKKWLLLSTSLGASLAPALKAGADTTYDFTYSSLPAEVTGDSNVVLTAGSGVPPEARGLALDVTTGRGNTFADGYVDISFADVADLSGKNIAFQAGRVNSLTNGGFDGPNNLTANCSTTADAWCYYHDGASASASLIASTIGSGNSIQFTSLGTNTYLQQIFEIDPGELYRISYALNASGITPAYTDNDTSDDGNLAVRMKYYAVDPADSSIDLLSFDIPSTTSAADGTLHVTNRSYEHLVKHTSLSEQYQRQITNMLDCDTRTIFDDGATTLSYSKYSLPATYPTCEDAAYYGQLTFIFDASASSGAQVELENVRVDWDRQLEAEIIDNADGTTVIQSSTLDHGFYVEDLSAYSAAGVTLRLHLRTQHDNRSPLLKKIIISDGMPISVTADTTLASFTEPRLGVDAHLPPKTVFESTDSSVASMPTDCIDFLDSNNQIPCWEFFAKYGVTGMRMQLGAELMDYTWNSLSNDYDITLNASGEHILDRLLEASNYGMTAHGLFYIHGDVSFWNDTACSIPHDGWEASRSDSDEAKYLVQKYAEAFVNELDGSWDPGLVVDSFEIFNEPNIDDFPPQCTSLIPVADVPALMNDVAVTINAARAGLDVSFSGLATNGHHYFDRDYFKDYLVPDLDPANFTHTNWHPYTDTFVPDGMELEWGNVDNDLATNGFSGLSHEFTEFGYQRSEYDPDCDATWERGYGSEAHGKLVARSTLTQLSLPIERIMAWGHMTYESEGYTTCSSNWRSDPNFMKTLFDRQSGTGYLDTGVLSDHSVYDANEGGIAFITIANYLSTSSPLSHGPPTLNNGNMAFDEHYPIHIYETTDGYVIALWWDKQDVYGDVRYDLGESSDTYYMNYMYGAKDHSTSTTLAYGVHDYGFEEKRLHDVTIDALPSLPASPSVYMVELDGLGTETLMTSSVSGTAITIEDVVYGDRPVLLLIR